MHEVTKFLQMLKI